MNLRSYSLHVPADRVAALAEFEREFFYPLGAACRFRISHGEDYLGFFRSMGEATLVVAENAGKINGSIARVEKVMILSNGRGGRVSSTLAHYLCDLKVSVCCRGSLVLCRLIQETKRQILVSDTRSCYSVVMGGTGRLPTDYTGRLGVPKFEKLGEIAILRVGAADRGGRTMSCRIVARPEISEVLEEFEPAGYHAAMTDRSCRSRMTPIHLLAGNGEACGMVEDTRRVKRLIVDAGEELVSAHLSSFRYKTAEAAGALLSEAAELAGAAGYPAIFTAVPSGKLAELRPWLARMEVTEASATIYGLGMERGMDWWIDTVEI